MHLTGRPRPRPWLGCLLLKTSQLTLRTMQGQLMPRRQLWPLVLRMLRLLLTWQVMQLLTRMLQVAMALCSCETILVSAMPGRLRILRARGVRLLCLLSRMRSMHQVRNVRELLIVVAMLLQGTPPWRARKLLFEKIPRRRCLWLRRRGSEPLWTWLLCMLSMLSRSRMFWLLTL